MYNICYIFYYIYTHIIYTLYRFAMGQDGSGESSSCGKNASLTVKSPMVKALEIFNNVGKTMS